jgi:hypothetical protein
MDRGQWQRLKKYVLLGPGVLLPSRYFAVRGSSRHVRVSFQPHGAGVLRVWRDVHGFVITV